MRVTTNNAAMEDTNEFWSGAFEKKRTTASFDLGSRKASDLNKTSTEGFEYSPDSGIANGGGFISYFKADMNKTEAV